MLAGLRFMGGGELGAGSRSMKLRGATSLNGTLTKAARLVGKRFIAERAGKTLTLSWRSISTCIPGLWRLLKKTLGLPMASGPTASRFLKRRWLGALTAATWLLTTGEICRFGDGSLVVTRQLEGKVLGLFSDLDVTWSKIWFSDTTYRSLFLPEGSEEVQKEPWRLPRSAIGLEADRLGVSSRVRFVIQVHLSLDQRSSWNAVHRRRVPCHGVVVLSSCVPRPHGVVVARRQRRLCWKECDHVEAKENRSARQHRSALGCIEVGSSRVVGRPWASCFGPTAFGTADGRRVVPA